VLKYISGILIDSVYADRSGCMQSKKITGSMCALINGIEQAFRNIPRGEAGIREAAAMDARLLSLLSGWRIIYRSIDGIPAL
jgi:hypothetical protein